MRTAKIRITPTVLFDMIGLEHFWGTVVGAEVNNATGNIEMKIIGDDERIPEGEDFPDCHVIVTKIQSHIKKIE